MRSVLAACRILFATLLVLSAAGAPSAVTAPDTTAEQRTVQELERIRSSPLELRDFLKRLTHEYVHAVETFSLVYADLKEIVRNSLDYSFLPGRSLWDEGGAHERVVEACRSDVRSDVPAADKPVAALHVVSRREREGRAAMGA